MLFIDFFRKKYGHATILNRARVLVQEEKLEKFWKKHGQAMFYNVARVIAHEKTSEKFEIDMVYLCFFTRTMFSVMLRLKILK